LVGVGVAAVVVLVLEPNRLPNPFVVLEVGRDPNPLVVLLLGSPKLKPNADSPCDATLPLAAPALLLMEPRRPSSVAGEEKEVDDDDEDDEDTGSNSSILSCSPSMRSRNSSLISPASAMSCVTFAVSASVL
jgi:hypothetical protein